MCPGRGFQQHGYAPNIPHVTMWSDKVVPYGYANGGMVRESHENIPTEALEHGDPDKVFARLQAGEMIIPKKHVSVVSRFLRKKGIILPGM